MTNIWKKSISMLLALVMVFGMVPVNALATETEPETLEAAEEATVPETTAEATEETAEVQETSSPETTAAVETEEASEPELVAPEEILEAPEEILEAPEEAMEAATDLASAVNAAIADGQSSYTISEDMTVSEDTTLTLPKGFKLYLKANLTVSNNATLTLNGDGALYIADGTFQVDPGATFTVYFANASAWDSRVIIQNNGILNVYGTMDIANDMELNAEEACVNVSGTLNNRGYLRVLQGVICVFDGGSLKNQERKVLDDTNGWTWGTFSIGDMLVVYDGGTLALGDNNGGNFVYGDGSMVMLSGAIAAEDGGSIAVQDDAVMNGVPNRIQYITVICDTLEEIKAALAKAENEGYGGVTAQTSGSVTIDSDLTIPENTDLLLYSDGMADIPYTLNEGVTLTVDGGMCVGFDTTLDVQGTIVNNGIFGLNGKLVNNGRFISSGSIVNDYGGTWEGNAAQEPPAPAADLASAVNAAIADGQSSYDISEDMTVSEDTTLTLPTGFKLRLKADLTVSNNATLTLNGDGALYIAKGTFTVEQGATVNVLFGEAEPFDSRIFVQSNGVLNVYGTMDMGNNSEVDAGGTVTISGTLKNRSVLCAWGDGKLEILNGGTLSNQERYLEDTVNGIRLGQIYLYGQMVIRSGGTLALGNNNSANPVMGFLTMESGAVVADDGGCIAVQDGTELVGVPTSIQEITFACDTMEALREALAKEGYRRITAHTTCSMVIDSDLTVPAGALLQLYSNSEGYGYVVNKGVTLTVEGDLVVSYPATLDVQGTVINNGTIRNYGSVWCSGTITDNGTWEGVQADKVGVLQQLVNAAVAANSSSYTISEDMTISQTETLTLPEDFTLYLDGGDLTVSNSAKLTLNGSGMLDIVSGTITVEAGAALDVLFAAEQNETCVHLRENGAVGLAGTMDVANGMQMDAGSAVSVSGTLNNRAILQVQSGANITVLNGGTLRNQVRLIEDTLNGSLLGQIFMFGEMVIKSGGTLALGKDNGVNPLAGSLTMEAGAIAAEDGGSFAVQDGAVLTNVPTYIQEITVSCDTLEEIEAALARAEDEGYHSVIAMTTSSAMNIDADLTIPENTDLLLYSDGTEEILYTLNEDITLTVDGTLIIGYAAALDVRGTIVNNGSISFNPNSKLINNGKVISSGSIVNDYGGIWEGPAAESGQTPVEKLQAGIDAAMDANEYWYLMTEDCTIPAGVVLALPRGMQLDTNGYDLTVASGAELYMDKESQLYIWQDSVLDVYGAVANWGQISVGSYGEDGNSQLNLYSGSQFIQKAEDNEWGMLMGGIILLYDSMTIAEDALVQFPVGMTGINVYGTLSVEDADSFVKNGSRIYVMADHGAAVTGVPNDMIDIVVRCTQESEVRAAMALMEEEGYWSMTVRMPESMVLSSDLKIPRNTHLVLCSEEEYDDETDEYTYIPQTVTVNEGVTLNVEGMLNLDTRFTMNILGELNILEGGNAVIAEMGEAVLNVSGTLTNNGTFLMYSQGRAVIDGQMVNSGRSFDNAGQIILNGTMRNLSTVSNTGTVTVKTGGVLTDGGSWTGTAPVVDGGSYEKDEMTLADLKEELAEAAAGNGVYELRKPVTVDGPLDVNVALLIFAGGKLTLENKAVLTIGEKGFLLVDGGQVDVLRGGKVVNKSNIRAHMGVERTGYFRIAQGATYTADPYSRFYVTAEKLETGWTLTEVQGVPEARQSVEIDDADLTALRFGSRLSDYGEVSLYIDDSTQLIISENTVIPENMVLQVFADNPSESGSDMVVEAGAVLKIYGRIFLSHSYNEAGDERGAVLENNGTIEVYGSLDDSRGQVIGNAPIYPEMSQTELETLLKNAGADDIVALNRTVKLTKNLTVSKNLQIMEGGQLIAESGTLTVTKTGTLAIGAGQVKLKGLNNAGFIYVYEDAETDTCLEVSGTCKNTGMIEVITDGTAEPTQVTGILAKDISLSINDADLNTVKQAVQVTGYDMISIYTYGFELTEDLTIPKYTYLCIVPTFGNEALGTGKVTVSEGATLTVNGGVVLNAYSEADYGCLHNDGTIILNKGGKLTNYGRYSGNLPLDNGGTMSPEPEVTKVEIAGEDKLTVTQRTTEVTLTVDAQAGGEGYETVIPAIAWSSSNAKVVDPADIEDNGDGTYTARIKGTGTAALTATASYGNTRTDRITLTVEPLTADALVLSQTEDLAVAMADEPRLQEIGVKGKDEIGEFDLTKSNVKWTSSDTKVATVTVGDAGQALVTVKGGQYGVVVLTAKSTDKKAATAQLVLVVQNTAPRMVSNKLTLDPMSITGVETQLMESYGNLIKYTGLYDTQKLKELEKAMTDPADQNNIGYFANALDEDLDTYYDQNSGSLYVYAEYDAQPKNASLKRTLLVKCADGKLYKFDMTITLKSSKPAVTVKQPDKMDLFYLNSLTRLTIHAKTENVSAIELISQDYAIDHYVDSGIYCPVNGIVQDGCYNGSETEDGRLLLKFSDAYLEKVQAAGKSVKPESKVTLKIWMNDCAYPVTQTVSVGTTTSKVNLVANPASGVIHKDRELVTKFCVYEKGYDFPLRLSADEIRLDKPEGKTLSIDSETSQISIAYDAVPKSGTETLYIQNANWAQPVKVTHKVSVTTKDPKAVLGTSTVTLTRQYVKAEPVYVSLLLDQNAIPIQGIEYEATGEAAKLLLEYENGYIKVRMDPEKVTEETLPNTGTYSFKITPYILLNDEQVKLNQVTLRVKVANAAAKYKLSASSVKLNTLLGDRYYPAETAVIDIRYLTDASPVILGFAGMDANSEAVKMTYEDGQLRVQLKEGAVAGKTYSFTLNPIVEYGYDEVTEEPNCATLSHVNLKLSVKAYSNAKVSARIAAKGKLDAINSESAITYTINSLTNVLGPVENVELVDDFGDYDKFQLDFDANDADAKGKQFFTLKMIPGETYSTKDTYKIKVRYSIGDYGYTFDSAELKVKVTQSTLKASVPTLQYYLSQTGQPLMVPITVKTPEYVQIDGLYLDGTKTSKELVTALGLADGDSLLPEELRSLDGDLQLWLDDISGLKAGKSYKLVMDVGLVGQATGAKIPQITVTIKVAK